MITKAALVIHPVRLRIAGALAARPMTTRALAAVLPDVPQASLYRQVRTLLRHGLLTVVARRRVNGIVECTYATKKDAAWFNRREFASIPPRDHARFFGVFLGTQMIDAETYFNQPAYDTTRDGMTYFRADLPLTDHESRALRIDLLAVMRRYRRDPGGGRRVRHLAVASIPEPRREERS